MQGLAIANWAAAERDVLSMMRAESKELSESIEFMGLRKFDPISISYEEVRSGRPFPVNAETQAVLYRFDDIHCKGWRRNMLVSKYGASFALDEQWSIWIAMGLVSRGFGRAPLYHDQKKGYLYIPAKLYPPAVIDRALVLCSGSPPEEHFLSSWEDGNEVNFGIKKADTVLFKLDEWICQGVGDGVWLRYENVPSAVINAISLKGK